jgi:hypothetical protein
MLSHRHVIGMSGSHSSTPSSTLTPLPSATAILELRVSVRPFQLRCFFFGRLPFALLVLQCRAAFSSLTFSKYIVRVALLFGPLAPHLAALAVAH